MTEIVLAENFASIHPEADLNARDIQVVSLDVENLLTDFGDPTVFPDAAEAVAAIRSKDIAIILNTNQKDRSFILKVLEQLDGVDDYVSPVDGYKKKPSPEMFRIISRDILGIDPRNIAHIDDQVKSYLGAQRAGYRAFFWTKPVGEHQHKGVKRFRPVEFGVIRPLISGVQSMREIRRGDY